MSLRQRLRRVYRDWIDRRQPRRAQLRLNQRSIYILPSKVGLAFSVLLLALLLLAINYQNNLIFGLCFWLFSIGLVTMYHSFGNLYALNLRAGVAESVFAGDSAALHLHLGKAKASAHNLRLVPEGGDTLELDEVSGEGGRAAILYVPTRRRGLLKPGRLRLYSDFPLGIFSCWSLPLLDWHCLVYPQPKLLRPLQMQGAGGEEGGAALALDSDEFSGFRRYEKGESPARIAWKTYAKGQGLYVKQFDQQRSDDVVLDWDSLADLGAEDRLSTLCAWALECERRGLAFALRLPGVSIDSDSGPGHLSAVLRELALYPGGESTS